VVRHVQALDKPSAARLTRGRWRGLVQPGSKVQACPDTCCSEMKMKGRKCCTPDAGCPPLAALVPPAAAPCTCGAWLCEEARPAAADTEPAPAAAGCALPSPAPQPRCARAGCAPTPGGGVRLMASTCSAKRAYPGSWLLPVFTSMNRAPSSSLPVVVEAFLASATSCSSSSNSSNFVYQCPSDCSMPQLAGP
jgi:hypothetical protein